MSHSWVCRPYQPGDECGIRDLYRDVFQIEMSPQLWEWMYQQNPAGSAVIVVLDDGVRLAGHYAVQPQVFWFAERKCSVGFAVGTMLRPEVRSVSALNELAQQAYLLCRQRNYPWLYAFPNDQAHRVRCGMLGWHALPEIVEWDGDLPRDFSGSVEHVRTWRQMPQEIDFKPVFSDAAHGSGLNHISAVRSKEWLQWRYFDRPNSEYVLHTLSDARGVAGYAVTKRYTREGVRYGHLLDWRLAPKETEPAIELLASIWNQLAEWEVERVSCWAKGQFELQECFEHAGLSMVGRKTNFCYFDLDNCQPKLLEQADAWQVEMADSDRY
jgi:hypothetical protein